MSSKHFPSLALLLLGVLYNLKNQACNGSWMNATPPNCKATVSRPIHVGIGKEMLFAFPLTYADPAELHHSAQGPSVNMQNLTNVFST